MLCFIISTWDKEKERLSSPQKITGFHLKYGWIYIYMVPYIWRMVFSWKKLIFLIDNTFKQFSYDKYQSIMASDGALANTD